MVSITGTRDAGMAGVGTDVYDVEQYGIGVVVKVGAVSMHNMAQ